MIADEGVSVPGRSWPSPSPTRPRQRCASAWAPCFPAARASMWVCTFHAMLRAHAARATPRPSATRPTSPSMTTMTQSAWSRSIMNDLGIDQKQFPINGIRSKISSAKNAMVGPAELESSTNPVDRAAGRVYRALTARLAKANAMDFDDLLVKTLRAALQATAGMLEGYQDRFLQIQRRRVPGHQPRRSTRITQPAGRQVQRTSCVVGDDDQSIYAWRGADIQNILDFEKDLPGRHARSRLEQNYRSTGHILERGQRRGGPQLPPQGQSACSPRPETARRSASTRLRTSARRAAGSAGRSRRSTARA